jgi:hypothetical protein
MYITSPTSDERNSQKCLGFSPLALMSSRESFFDLGVANNVYLQP